MRNARGTAICNDISDNANKTNRDENIFSANVKSISKSISEYDELIKDVRKSLQLPKLVFQKNKKLTEDMYNPHSHTATTKKEQTRKNTKKCQLKPSYVVHVPPDYITFARRYFCDETCWIAVTFVRRLLHDKIC